jgi:hypothetical protein
LNFNDEFGISIEEIRQETAFILFFNKLKQGLLNKLVIQSAEKEVTLFKDYKSTKKRLSCYSGLIGSQSQLGLYRFEKRSA